MYSVIFIWKWKVVMQLFLTHIILLSAFKILCICYATITLQCIVCTHKEYDGIEHKWNGKADRAKSECQNKERWRLFCRGQPPNGRKWGIKSCRQIGGSRFIFKCCMNTNQVSFMMESFRDDWSRATGHFNRGRLATYWTISLHILFIFCVTVTGQALTLPQAKPWCHNES